MDLKEEFRKVHERLDKLKDQKAENKFIPGKSLIRHSGQVLGHEEYLAQINTVLNGWFGLGDKAKLFEKSISKYMQQKGGIFVNSGSSANLLAISSLRSYEIGEKRLNIGDEVIVCACCFPTTVAPLFYNGLKPRFIDIEIGSYTTDPNKIREAITNKTKAVFLVHHLGNPNKLEEILEICNENNLILIEDCCDALGSTYNDRKVGAFSIASTLSFYPAHHITTGEGGMILSSDEKFLKIAKSLRDWGRDCYCNSKSISTRGECGKRFDSKYGDLPHGTDHRYVYSELGFNLKPIEVQAAIGLEQLKKINDFNNKRNKNFNRLQRFFKKYEDLFIIPKKVDEKAKPVWFAYPLTINTDKFTRKDLTTYLESKHIHTRPFFSGNILRHPVFTKDPYLKDRYSISGELKNSDIVCNNSFFLGIYPGITDVMIDYMKETIKDFIDNC